MATMVVEQESFRMTIIALGKASVDMKKAARLSAKAAGAVLLERVKSNASRTDHSAADLARLDHPYARRHGAIKSGVLGPDYRKRPYMVHKRTGAFLSSFKGKSLSSPIGYEIEARPVVPWVRYVIQGTRVMLGRDIIWETAHEKETKKAMMAAIVYVLGKGLRAQAAVRFN